MLALPTTTTTGRGVTSSSLFTLGVLLLASNISQPSGVLGNYLTYDVPGGGQECIYDLLQEDEYVTMSVFIGEGEHLECTSNFEGPLAPEHVTEGGDLVRHAHKFEEGFTDYAEYRTKGQPVTGYDDVSFNGNVRLTEFITYEEETMRMILNEYDDDDDFDDGMDAGHGDVDDHLVIERRMQQNSRKMEKQTDKREIEKRRIKENLGRMYDGLPFERTIRVYAAGWYRVCVVATHSDIWVEIDMRKSSENGKPTDELNGHVPAHENDNTYFDTEEVPGDVFGEAAEEWDLDGAKDVLRDLHNTLNVIKNKQEAQQHQNQSYESINSHSHSRLRNSSMLETMVFFAVSAFQVYTIRKWFSGGPMLGR